MRNKNNQKLLGLFLIAATIIGISTVIIVNADISNYAVYTQYNNLSLEDTQSGPVTNTVNGTYTVPVLSIVKYVINRRPYPSGTNWSDTVSVNAVIGDTLEYRITWQQIGVGAPAETVVIIDAMPNSMTFIDSSIVSGLGTLTFSSNTLSWTKYNVVVGETGEFRFRVRAQ